MKEQQPDLSTQLARGREAVRITRRILSEYPDMRADLREVSFLVMLHKYVWVEVLTVVSFCCSFWDALTVEQD